MDRFELIKQQNEMWSQWWEYQMEEEWRQKQMEQIRLNMQAQWEHFKDNCYELNTTTQVPTVPQNTPRSKD